MRSPEPTDTSRDKIARTAGYVAVILALAPRGEKMERLMAAGMYYGVYLLVSRAARPSRLRLPTLRLPSFMFGEPRTPKPHRGSQ